MKAFSKPQIIVFALGLGGAVLLFVLIRNHGITDVMAAVRSAGWGLVLVILFHLVPLCLDSLSWRVLFPKERRPPLRQIYWMRWIGEAVSTVLPAAQVGGDVVRARLAIIRKVASEPVVAATVLVDITASILTQTVFTIGGLILLGSVTGHSLTLGRAAIGVGVAVILFGGFYAVQQFGIFRLMATIAVKMADSELWQSMVPSGEAFDRAVRDLYARRRAVAGTAFWTMASWIVGAGEVWIALHLLGVQAGFTKALILESVGQGIRAAAFLIPGALGVFEGGYMVVGGLLGIPTGTALALAFIRRARELAFGVPGVIAWQWIEGVRAWHPPVAPVAEPVPVPVPIPPSA